MISIIVPVFNEEAGLKKFISNLQKHISGEKAELIFIDGGSTDKTGDKCESSSVNQTQPPNPSAPMAQQKVFWGFIGVFRAVDLFQSNLVVFELVQSNTHD